MARASSPGSVYTVSSDEASDYAPESSHSGRAAKRPRISGSKRKLSVKASKPIACAALGAKAETDDIEDSLQYVHRPHASGYHAVDRVAELQQDLLNWFERVREKRGMPWRKAYDPSLTMEQKGQRAYEIWVSEVMLQQTQVTTVIAYWQKWIAKWPTIADLAEADIEKVNSAWRGLGYYRRARSLLEGAKTVMSDNKYKGRLPDDPDVLEKEISGVGRYTAGAICSMAYGARAPIIDGNIHRLFTRLLAVHSPQTAPSTTKFLWAAAEQLVDRLPRGEGKKGIAGDWNQALMELGSQICKPVAPLCRECPMLAGCKAFAETTSPPPPPSANDECELCAPIPSISSASTIPSVAIFPMKKEKKESRIEEEVVCITSWTSGGERRWLFVKRPDKGLLAGLFEPPTTPVSAETSAEKRCQASMSTVASLLKSPAADLAASATSHTSYGSIPHVFSHINMTYHIQHLILRSDSAPPTPADPRAVWLDDAAVEHANVGTGVKKVWAEVFGTWGSLETGTKPVKKASRAVKSTKREGKAAVEVGEKVVRRIMMPSMPNRKAAETE